MNRPPETGSATVDVPPWQPTTTNLIPVSLPARVHHDPDGAIWADVPALPGCVAGGSRTRRSAGQPAGSRGGVAARQARHRNQGLAERMKSVSGNSLS